MLQELVPAAGVEPAAFRSGGERSNPLSYAGVSKIADFKEVIRNVPLFVPLFVPPRQYRAAFGSGARLTRLTNGFSKKWENLKAAYALHFAHYNFCRIHSSIKCTAAIEAKITKRVWDLKDLLTA